MKKVYKSILILSVVVSHSVMAQTETPSDTSYWKKGGTGNLTFSNVGLTNWAAGGENSVTLNAYLGLYASYVRDRTTWENTLDLGYGLLKQGEGDYTKSDDKISLTTKYGIN